MSASQKLEHATIAIRRLVADFGRKVELALAAFRAGHKALTARMDDLEKRMDAMTQTQTQLDQEIAQVAADEQSLAATVATNQQTLNATIASLRQKLAAASDGSGTVVDYAPEITQLQAVDTGLQQIAASLAPATSATTSSTTTGTTSGTATPPPTTPASDGSE